MQDLNDKKFDTLEISKLKAKIINLDILNLTNVDISESDSTSENSLDEENNKLNHSLQFKSLQSMGSLINENKNLKKVLLNYPKAMKNI